MVTPDDLIGIARQLAAFDSEPWWRCSISRAYYAAFHHLRGVLEEQVGLPSFGTSDDHRDLEDALRLVGGPAESFSLLRRQRNFADYALDDAVSRRQASDVLALAEHLLTWS